MISYIISRTVIMVFGTLYPAYASYKAVRSRNVREYVKWMMYWIVFAIFTCLETFTDIFLSWFPFYYELKILLVIWLLAPATKGSSILYRKFVHPTLSNREQEIDEYISKAKEQSYRQVLDLGSRGVSALMQTALKNVIPGALLTSISNMNEAATQSSTNNERERERKRVRDRDVHDGNVVEQQNERAADPMETYEFYTDNDVYSDEDETFVMRRPRKTAVPVKTKTESKSGRPKRAKKASSKKTAGDGDS